MATIFFDGKSNVTATKNDAVIITAPASSFLQASDNGAGGSSFVFGSGTLTFTDVTVADADGVATLAGGTFNTSPTGTVTTTSRNDLIINTADSQLTTFGNAVDSTGVHAIFGGLGRSGPADGADNLAFAAGQLNTGSYLVLGNGGADTIANGNGTFDSTSFVTVFGGAGADTITLGGGDKANIFVAGGEGSDVISVSNKGSSGSTTILGGTGPGDAADSADTITLTGGGTFTIYGNGGADTITLASLDSTTRGTVFGGEGADTINATSFTGIGGTLTSFGGNGSDVITVSGNAGRTVIYGGAGPGDPTDAGDSISFTSFVSGTSSSNATIYGNGGDDTIAVSGNGAAGTGAGNTSSATSVFGGIGADIISVSNTGASNGTYLLTGNEGLDTFGIGTNAAGTGAALTGTFTGRTVTITDFVSGTDRLAVNSGAGANTPVTNLGNLSSSGSIDAALAQATATGVSRVAVFQFGTDSYLVTNDTNAGFNASADAAVRLQNVTADATLVNSITVVA